MTSQTSSNSPTTLDKWNSSAPAKVVHIGSDLLDLQRLKAMGLCAGQHVRVLRTGARMIVCTCGTRIGMSARLAKSIEVEPLTNKVVS